MKKMTTERAIEVLESHRKALKSDFIELTEERQAIDKAIEAMGVLKGLQIGVCNRTKTPVYPSVVDGYTGYCPELDEDLCTVEYTEITNDI